MKKLIASLTVALFSIAAYAQSQSNPIPVGNKGEVYWEPNNAPDVVTGFVVRSTNLVTLAVYTVSIPSATAAITPVSSFLGNAPNGVYSVTLYATNSTVGLVSDPSTNLYVRFYNKPNPPKGLGSR